MLNVDIYKKLGDIEIKAKFETDGASITALFGASGAGKSSVINMISGLITPDKGSIRFNNRELFDSTKKINIPAEKRNIGYIFQDGRLFPHLTVKKNLLYGSKSIADNDGAKIDFDHVVNLLGISHILDRHPERLSGGEKQRVAIGRALLSNPTFLLMDEPLSALDNQRKGELLEYISKLPLVFNIPIIYVTHSIDEIIQLADTVGYMANGSLVKFGKTVDVLSDLELGHAMQLKDFGVIYDGVVSFADPATGQCIISFAGGEIDITGNIAVGSKVRFRIPAAEVVLSTDMPPATTVRNIFKGEVKNVIKNKEFMTDILIDIGTPLWVRVITRAVDSLSIKQGKTVWAMIKNVVVSNQVYVR